MSNKKVESRVGVCNFYMDYREHAGPISELEDSGRAQPSTNLRGYAFVRDPAAPGIDHSMFGPLAGDQEVPV